MVSTLAAVTSTMAAATYLTGSLLQARRYRAQAQSTSLGNDTNADRASSQALIGLAVVGALLHAFSNFQVIWSDGGLVLDLATSVSLVSWIMLVFVLLASFRLPLANLLVLVLPLAALGALLLMAAPARSALPTANLSDPLIWHILISIVAYSILFMAACQSVLLAVLEHRLKAKQTLRFLKLLPPLQTMESLLFGLLWTGIIALTFAIGSGFLFLDDMFEQRVVHHTVLALASWVLYAALLAGHRVFGWRGTTAVRWTLIAFSLLLLGYLGSKFVIEVLLES
jgi:ABC-type uncharacterized transport system permease subunit